MSVKANQSKRNRSGRLLFTLKWIISPLAVAICLLLGFLTCRELFREIPVPEIVQQIERELDGGDLSSVKAEAPRDSALNSGERQRSRTDSGDFQNLLSSFDQKLKSAAFESYGEAYEKVLGPISHEIGGDLGAWERYRQSELLALVYFEDWWSLALYFPKGSEEEIYYLRKTAKGKAEIARRIIRDSVRFVKKIPDKCMSAIIKRFDLH